jgi:two-component system phosphate regulon sensor histidine kinase PhoR
MGAAGRTWDNPDHMEAQAAAPFHFAVEFLILTVCAGAAVEAWRSRGPGAWARWLGFAALVAAQVVHGALLAADGDPAVLALRAVGFGLVALGLGAGESAGPAPAPAIFVAGSAATFAVIPGALALAAAARALAGRRASPRGAAPLAGAFACFAAGELLLASARAGGLALALSHAARAAGAMLLARWLWLSLVRSVRLRLVAVFVTGLVLLVTVVAAALTQVIGANLRAEELTRLEIAARGQRQTIDLRVDEAIRTASSLARGVEDRFATPATLPGFARAIFAEARGLLPADADFLAFLSPSGAVVDSAREVRQPDGGLRYVPLDAVEQLALAGSEVVARALDGPRAAPAGDVVPIGLTRIAALGASPVQAAGRRLLGAVVVGYDLDRELLARLRVGAEADITVLRGGEVVSTTFEDPRRAAALAGGGLRRLVRREAEEQGRIVRATAAPGGERSLVVYAPITADDGARVVGVLALSRPAGLLDASQRAVNRILFLVTLAASAGAAALAWWLAGRITRPISALTRAARRVREGDLDARATVDLPDEVGMLGAAFNEMASSLKRMTDDLRGAAEAEANLRARMEAIMQSMGDALVATDAGGTVVAFNRAAEGMLGVAAGAALGRRLADVLPGQADDGHGLADAALAGEVSGFTATVAGPGGPVPVAVTGAPLRDAAGEVVGRVIVLRDVSREREAERMKTEFLSNVSHELRTPLTPIKGYTEILRRKRFPPEKAARFLDGIAESTSRLERIVEILVDFAAMEAGRLKPSLEPVDLGRFLAGLAEAWAARAPGHRIRRSVPAGLPPVLGDERLLRRAVDELLDNAVKFSPAGGDIEIVAEAHPEAGRRRRPEAVRVTVRDHGIGIEPRQMAHLFQDFRQLDGSETRTFGGLGLGLAFARRVALAHGGDITAESEPGRGSAFTLTLPAAPAAARPRRARGGARRVDAAPRPTEAERPIRARKRVAAVAVPRRSSSRAGRPGGRGGARSPRAGGTR